MLMRQGQELMAEYMVSETSREVRARGGTVRRCKRKRIRNVIQHLQGYNHAGRKSSML